MTAVHAFEEDKAPASRLAATLGAPLEAVDLHRFPDGESLPSVQGVQATAILYRSLAHPDAKIVPLLLAADALRRTGAHRVVLVVPYMPYLRQDAVFAPGQPLSRDVFGALLGPAFDRIVTVEPHLHRTRDLTTVFAGTPVTVCSAAAELAQAIGRVGRPLIAGPDLESEAWAGAVAADLGADHFVFEKHRHGDRDVEAFLPDGADVTGRRVVLVDDISSSGGTLEAVIRRLAGKRAASIEIALVHALFDPATEALLRIAGARSIISTDACEHPTNTIQLAGLLAGALEDEIAA